jgi:lysophospholipase L1-like esterase
MRGVARVSAIGWVVFGFVIAYVQMRGESVTSQTPAPTPLTPQATSPAPVPPVSTSVEMAKQIAAMEAKLADWPQLGRYRTENAALAPVVAGEQRVVFYGDSITDSWGRQVGTGEFFPGKPYVNRGISGQTTPQMVVRFRQDVIDLHPTAVVILAGTNDVAGNTGPMTPQMTEDNFRSMIDLAKANGIRVIVASILPVADYPWKTGLAPAPKIRTVNDWLKGYCVNHSVTYLDYYSAMVGEDGGMKAGISFDGVHPNAEGYAIMAPLAQAAIDKTLGSR